MEPTRGTSEAAMQHVTKPLPGTLWKVKKLSECPRCFEPIWLHIGMLVSLRPIPMSRWFDTNDHPRFVFEILVGEKLFHAKCDLEFWNRFLKNRSHVE